MSSFEPYVQAQKFRTFEGAKEFAPGLRSIALPGHTKGHTGYQVESQGQSLLIWGDVVHVASVQFAHPGVTIQFDGDAKEAAGERSQLFAQAAKERTLVAGAHLPFPGLGHVRKQGDAYEWVPLEYSAMR
jgi:glyoxylase-like metal-dependent hydrolase (beta-lactamase superfamily II)